MESTIARLVQSVEALENTQRAQQNEIKALKATKHAQQNEIEALKAHQRNLRTHLETGQALANAVVKKYRTLDATSFVVNEMMDEQWGGAKLKDFVGAGNTLLHDALPRRVQKPVYKQIEIGQAPLSAGGDMELDALDELPDDLFTPEELNRLPTTQSATAVAPQRAESVMPPDMPDDILLEGYTEAPSATRSQSTPSGMHSSRYAPSRSTNPNCYQCGQPGHKMYQCPQLRTSQQRQGGGRGRGSGRGK